MSKLSDWMDAATENRVFVATVTAAALTTAIYVSGGLETEIAENVAVAYEQSIGSVAEVTFEDEMVTFNENYWHLSEMLEVGDRGSAIELVAQMKAHIGDMRGNLSLAGPDSMTDATKLAVLDNAVNNIEAAIKSGEADMLDRVALVIDNVNEKFALAEGLEPEYEAVALGQ